MDDFEKGVGVGREKEGIKWSFIRELDDQILENPVWFKKCSRDRDAKDKEKESSHGKLQSNYT